MKKNGNILDRVAIAVDLPGEAVPGSPLIEIAGERRVLIENHRGVVQYGETEICLRVSYGFIKVRGCSLRLIRMTRQQVIISGRIDGIELCRGARK
jgi:sporulation protein YqfC